MEPQNPLPAFSRAPMPPQMDGIEVDELDPQVGWEIWDKVVQQADILRRVFKREEH